MSDLADFAEPSRRTARWTEEVRRTSLGLWRLLTRFDVRAIHIGMAARNTLGVLAPLALGTALGWPRAGLAAAGGALATSFSDGPEPYRERARHMLTAS